jgi:putative multiple sugar transport system permease protein
VAFVAIIALFAILTGGTSLSPGNITNIVLQYSYILVLAIGMVIVIIAGHIDLSVGSVVALTGAVSAVLVIRNGAPWWVGMLAAIAVGLAVGAWHGFWVAYVGIPAFIVTLAGMLLFRGLTLQVLDNISLSPFPAGYQKVASGFSNGLLGGQGFDAFTLLIGGIAVAGYAFSQFRTRIARIGYKQPVESFPLFVARIVAVGLVVMYFAWQLAHARGLPYVLVILAVLIIAYGVITNRSVFGRQVYAIGGNLAAATLSGVKVKVVNFWIFVNMGFLASVAGIIYSSRSNGAQPAAGQNFELDAIAAAFIGGAAVTGGVGTVGGAMVGGLLVAVLSNGMQLQGVDQSIQSVIKGLILLLAVAFDVYNKRRAGASR